MRLRVVIADDHQLFRDGLRSLLDKEQDFEVVGEAADGRILLEVVRTCKPHLVVADISMPELNGIDATRQLLLQDADIRVIALSMHKDKRLVLGMLGAGAQGYVLKDCALEELVRALRVVSAGRIYLSPDIAGHVAQEAVRIQETRQIGIPSSTLTQREREVLQLIAEGRSTKEIAKRLGLSTKTIETHRQHLMEKLDVRSIAELTKCAIRLGLTTLDAP